MLTTSQLQFKYATIKLRSSGRRSSPGSCCLPCPQCPPHILASLPARSFLAPPDLCRMSSASFSSEVLVSISAWSLASFPVWWSLASFPVLVLFLPPVLVLKLVPWWESSWGSLRRWSRPSRCGSWPASWRGPWRASRCGSWLAPSRGPWRSSRQGS